MITLTTIVLIVVGLIIAAVIFGLLHWLVGYVGRQFEGSEPFVKIARIILAIGAVLILIVALLSLVSGQQIIIFK